MGYLYVTDRSKGIAVYDIHNPASPVFLKLISCKAAFKFNIANGFLYLAEMSKGFRVIKDQPSKLTQAVGMIEKDTNGIVFSATSEDETQSYIWSPDGNQIIFLAKLPEVDTVFISDTQKIKPQKLFSGTNVEILSFTKDGKKIIYGFESMMKNGEKDIGVYNLIINKTTYWAGNWGDNYDPAPIILLND